MTNKLETQNQIQFVSNFNDLIKTHFQNEKNAICWNRELVGDYSEIVQKLDVKENIIEIELDQLHALKLTEQGQIARETIIQDMKLLENHGALPSLNLIKCYDRDEHSTFFPTDVYSFHVDRSPVPTSTFLCTYIGDTSEIIPNNLATQKILIPEIRKELQKIHSGSELDFEAFLVENYFDLHYLAHSNTIPTKQKNGHLWRLAVDHPESKVLPCIHRAPIEKSGQWRLLLIC